MQPLTPKTDRDPSDFLPEKYPRLHFDDADWQHFGEQCAALNIPEVTDAHRDTLEKLYSHLVGVNEWLNLTRITSPADYLKFQVLDSLSVLNTIVGMTEETSAIVDLGSGGGYPGLPLMTWMTTQDFTLVDARQKKVEFLNATIPLIPRAGRGGAASFRGRDVGRTRTDLWHHAEIVTARAVGKGVELLPDVSELLAIGGVFVLMKGQSWPQEEAPLFAEACPAFGFEQVEDIAFSLVPNDPVRHVILAVKKGHGIPKKMRKYLKQA